MVSDNQLKLSWIHPGPGLFAPDTIRSCDDILGSYKSSSAVDTEVVVTVFVNLDGDNPRILVDRCSGSS